MGAPTRPPANAFVRHARKIYNPVGFSKGYNFTLFVIFAGALMGFSLSRFQYLDINGVFCAGGRNGAAPGECYYYRQGLYKIGILLHLATILPAAFLACFQFVPVIRYKALLAHRINGYIIILLIIPSHAGALMIARYAFGGDLATQTGVGMLAIMTTGSIFLAYYNIKRLQIDQHRAWMLRTWFYMGSIITLRFILITASNIISLIGSYYIALPCFKIDSMMDEQEALLSHPDCIAYYNGTNPSQHSVTSADFVGNVSETAASLDLSFGTALWLALAVHAIGVEIYLSLTPRESERLRQVSYERQTEAGFKNPGSAGLTVDRWGDAEPWVPGTDKSSK